MKMLRMLWAHSPVEVAVYGSIVVIAGVLLGLLVAALAYRMDWDVLEDME